MSAAESVSPNPALLSSQGGEEVRSASPRSIWGSSPVIMASPGHMSSLKSVNATLCVEIRLKLCNVLPPALTIHALRVLLMRSTNHRKYPTRSYRNDSDFVSFGDSSASVLVTRNAARFDGELSTTDKYLPQRASFRVARLRTCALDTRRRCRISKQPFTLGRRRGRKAAPTSRCFSVTRLYSIV